MKDNYEKSRMAVDAVIFTIHEGKLKILLHEREKDPFKGKKELPGGLLQINETAEQTLTRKIKEIVGAQEIFFQQFYTFTDPKRDPRDRTVSIGFIALINSSRINDLSKWFDCNNIKDLAFDHKLIVDKAKEYLKSEINSIIVKQFMSEQFPLNKLQEAYEIIENVEYDNRNFRRQMITSGIVKETKKLEKSVSHRPAKFY